MSIFSILGGAAQGLGQGIMTRAQNIERRRGEALRNSYMLALEERRHANRMAEAEAQRTFQSGEAAVERDWRSGEAQAERTFRSGEAATERQFRSGEAAAERGFRSGEAATAREFSAEQAAIGREHQADLQTQAIESREKIAVGDRAARIAAADKSYQAAMVRANATAKYYEWMTGRDREDLQKRLAVQTAATQAAKKESRLGTPLSEKDLEGILTRQYPLLEDDGDGNLVPKLDDEGRIVGDPNLIGFAKQYWSKNNGVLPREVQPTVADLMQDLKDNASSMGETPEEVVESYIRYGFNITREQAKRLLNSREVRAWRGLSDVIHDIKVPGVEDVVGTVGARVASFVGPPAPPTGIPEGTAPQPGAPPGTAPAGTPGATSPPPGATPAPGGGFVGPPADGGGFVGPPLSGEAAGPVPPPSGFQGPYQSLPMSATAFKAAQPGGPGMPAVLPPRTPSQPVAGGVLPTVAGDTVSPEAAGASPAAARALAGAASRGLQFYGSAAARQAGILEAAGAGARAGIPAALAAAPGLAPGAPDTTRTPTVSEAGQMVRDAFATAAAAAESVEQGGPNSPAVIGAEMLGRATDALAQPGVLDAITPDAATIRDQTARNVVAARDQFPAMAGTGMIGDLWEYALAQATLDDLIVRGRASTDTRARRLVGGYQRQKTQLEKRMKALDDSLARMQRQNVGRAMRVPGVNPRTAGVRVPAPRGAGRP